MVTGGRGGGFGPLAIPGTYTVELWQRVDGEVTQLVPPVEFTIEPIGWGEMSAGNQLATGAFNQQLAQLQNAVMGAYRIAQETRQQLEAIKQLADSAPQVTPDHLAKARELEMRLMDIMEAFSGDPTRPQRNEPGLQGILGRLQTAIRGSWGSISGPTQTHHRQFEIAVSQFNEALNQLKQVVEQDVPALYEQLDQAGAPWTPGRKLPAWNK